MNRADLVSGPHDYWSTAKPPSRGQYRDLAELALELLGIPQLQTRYDASVAQVRLRAALEQKTPMPELPSPW